MSDDQVVALEERVKLLEELLVKLNENYVHTRAATIYAYGAFVSMYKQMPSSEYAKEFNKILDKMEKALEHSIPGMSEISR